MRRLLPVIACALSALVACGSPAAPPDPLTSLIVQDGDFARPYRTRADPMPWRIYPGIPTTPTAYYHEIILGTDDRNEVGHIAVLRYADSATADQAYAAVKAEAELEKQSSPLPFGEVGSQSGPSDGWNESDVLFRRCNTIVHVSLMNPTLEIVVPYAQKLHDRIQPIVCADA
jgi:hypothetical protein